MADDVGDGAQRDDTFMNICWRLAAILGVLTAGGCSGNPRPVPAATVQKDLSSARQEAAEKNASAARGLAVADAGKVEAQYKARITAADGEHQIALVQCEALSGDTQRACRDQADAKFELAKANAKVAKIEHR